MIKYPNGPVKKQAPIYKFNRKNQSHSNRGMTLEDYINQSNKYYNAKGVACIHKRATPIQIVESIGAKVSGYFREQSQCDYVGIYNGRYLDFEAKETSSTTSFPLQNIKEHQVKHMKQVLKQNGTSFVIIRFSTLDEIYVLDATHLIDFWNHKEKGGRKSIPKAYIEENGHYIPIGYNPCIHYLGAIEFIVSGAGNGE